MRTGKQHVFFLYIFIKRQKEAFSKTNNEVLLASPGGEGDGSCLVIGAPARRHSSASTRPEA